MLNIIKNNNNNTSEAHAIHKCIEYIIKLDNIESLYIEIQLTNESS